MQPQKDLAQIKNILIPFRHNSRNSKISLSLAENLTAGNPSKRENVIYYELFADALFFTEPGGFDRIGAFHAFEGLEELLNAALDFLNSSLEIKRRVTGALEEFRFALEEYDRRALPQNCFRARPEKQNNIVTYYLSATRKYFLPSNHLTDVFDERTERNLTADELTIVKSYFQRRGALLYSEPAANQLNALISKFEEDGTDEKSISEIRRLGRAVIINLNERWRKICLVGYRGTRQGAETPATPPEKIISRSDKTAWAVATAMKFLPASAIEKEDVLSVLPHGAIADALRLCFKRGKYD